MQSDSAIRTDIQNMAASLAEDCLNAGLELLQKIVGNKCLNRTGKTATVDTVSSPTME